MTLSKAINWNDIEDSLDLDVWNKLVANFWLPEKVALSNDLQSWATMTHHEKQSTMKVFAGLTMLDTLQSVFGAPSLISDAITDHEQAVYTNIAFMESVHAKSYSSIFSTLCSTTEIDDLYRWAENNPHLNAKRDAILRFYKDSNGEFCDLKKKIASVFLEGFLFYSGFFMPLYWASRNKLPNTADIIRLIIRDESVHGFYIGAKFQEGFQALGVNDQEKIKAFANDLLSELYEIELAYTGEIYDELHLSEYVRTFVRYNANKALSNLGFEPRFKESETNVIPSVLSALSSDNETHDFFSSQGNSYIMTPKCDTSDEDWDF